MTNTIRKSFFDNGYVSNLTIFDEKEADEINYSYHEFLKTCNKRSLLVEHKSKTHLFFEWANKLIYNDKIIDNVSKILGSDIYCWNSLIFYKPPFSKSFVSMHQDQHYWGTKDKEDNVLTVQVAISNSNIKNGCLKILSKSHKSKFIHEDYSNRDNMLARGQTVFLKKNEKSRMKNMILSKGQCCIFHGNIVHGSMANNSNEPRFLFSIRYLTPDVKINKSLYYNDATLIAGIDKHKNFNEEKKIGEFDIIKLREDHRNILLSQFKRYLTLKIKVKVIVNLAMFFLQNDYLRGFLYFLIKKT